jgi:fructan beta-fructosidase
LGFTLTANGQLKQQSDDEKYRPLIHFTPERNWMNDPNGMVYYKGTYHLFYQYHPGSSVWGPMHWGHATSKDLLHWKHEPVALFPDSLGTIFSGSAVVDINNTSGFGKDGQVPIVAIFTQHNMAGEKAGRNDFQNQSIAYSLDEGLTWIKYQGNPVLRNPGISDFRDPKVMWYEPGKKWIMTLAVKDHIRFYSSRDLKSWEKESEFGKDFGAHGGVWECPDLFPMEFNGKQTWVLIVSLNPGAPNGGSGTQYFLGDFDGKEFIPYNTDIKWLDYGPDDYAGVTWSDTGKRKIFLGWMSNWLYATVVPTEKWRSAMTIPRELSLKKSGNDIFIASDPVKELTSIESAPMILKNVTVTEKEKQINKKGVTKFPVQLKLSIDQVKDFSIILSNAAAEKLVIGFDKKTNQYFIDRTHSGKTGFQKDFAGKHTAPRLTTDTKMNMTLLIDVSSVELFADDGLSVMTAIFFPFKPYKKVQIKSSETFRIQQLELIKLKSIW